jgi:hypothetical protein
VVPVRWVLSGVPLHGHREPRTELGFIGSEGGPNEVWSYGAEAYAAITTVMPMRERLRPYLHAALAAAPGLPLLRPLFLKFPDDSKAWDIEDQLPFGPDLLVAPVLEAGARERSAYLPSGVTWTHAGTGERFDGGTMVTVAAPLDTIPLFLRDGAELPLFPRGAPMRRTLPSLLLAAGLSVSLAVSIVPAQAAPAAGPTVTVNLASLGKTPNRAGAGFLYGLSQDGSAPSDTLMQPLRPTLFRGGGARIAGHGWLGDGYTAGSGYRVRVNSAIGQARRVTAAPYNASYHLLVSDVWGADTEQPADTVYPCDNGDCSNWQTFIRQLVNDVGASGVKVSYDIWNEPDGTGFWKRGVNSAQYFQMWDTAVRTIRSIDPGAAIVGPSYSGYNGTWLAQFVGRGRDNGTLPTVLNWHFGNDPAADAADATAIQQNAGITPLPMTINEYLFSGQQNPAYLTWFLGRLTTSNVTAAAHAIWSDCCTAGTLDTVLTGGVNPQPTGEWWTYRAYANLTGRLAAVTSTDPATFGAAALDSARAGVLVGTSTAQTGAATVTVNSIPTALTSGGKVWVSVQRLTTTSPATVSNTQLTVSGGTVTVPLNRVAGTDAYSLVLTPQQQTPPGSGQATSVDAPAFTYNGTWGQANGITDMLGGTANWSSTPGSTAAFTFTGTRIALHAVRDVDQGILAVHVDSAADTQVDDYAATRNASGTVWTSPTLAVGTHTITVRVTGNRNAASAGTVVALDYAEVTP